MLWHVPQKSESSWYKLSVIIIEQLYLFTMADLTKQWDNHKEMSFRNYKLKHKIVIRWLSQSNQNHNFVHLDILLHNSKLQELYENLVTQKRWETDAPRSEIRYYLFDNKRIVLGFIYELIKGLNMIILNRVWHRISSSITAFLT